MIKAIETKYNGYRFRSRLEARWAVFFDKLDIKYEYEPEGFDLDGVWYLPDFWLPGLYCPSWVEIKGQAPTEVEMQKALALQDGLPTWKREFTEVDIECMISACDCTEANAPRHLLGQSYEVITPVLIIAGPPHVKMSKSWYIERADYVVYEAHRYDENGHPCHVWSTTNIFCKCRNENCTSVWIEDACFHVSDVSISSGGGHGFCHSEKCGYAADPQILSAYAIASQVRFEHGENGR